VLFHILAGIPCWAANYIPFMSIFGWVTHRSTLKSITLGKFPLQHYLVYSEIKKRLMKTLNSFEIRGQNEKPSDFYPKALSRMS